MSAPENPLAPSPALPEPPYSVSPLPIASALVEDPPWNIWDVAGLAVISLVTIVACVLGAAYFVHRRFSPATPWIESLRRPEVIVGGQLLAYLLVLVVMTAWSQCRATGR